mmetsp:Transcript_4560/g.9941  ORF Transcript_4560/g.9941 Transcript_4560/m.9941 type:complete len:228 (+) Transcript_4560:333-1016(+)
MILRQYWRALRKGEPPTFSPRRFLLTSSLLVIVARAISVLTDACSHIIDAFGLAAALLLFYFDRRLHHSRVPLHSMGCFLLVGMIAQDLGYDLPFLPPATATAEDLQRAHRYYKYNVGCKALMAGFIPIVILVSSASLIICARRRGGISSLLQIIAAALSGLCFVTQVAGPEEKLAGIRPTDPESTALVTQIASGHVLAAALLLSVVAIEFVRGPPRQHHYRKKKRA